MTGRTLPASMSSFRTSRFSRLDRGQERPHLLAPEAGRHDRADQANDGSDPFATTGGNEDERPLGGQHAPRADSRRFPPTSTIRS